MSTVVFFFKTGNFPNLVKAQYVLQPTELVVHLAKFNLVLVSTQNVAKMKKKKSANNLDRKLDVHAIRSYR